MASVWGDGLFQAEYSYNFDCSIVECLDLVMLNILEIAYFRDATAPAKIRSVCRYTIFDYYIELCPPIPFLSQYNAAMKVSGYMDVHNLTSECCILGLRYDSLSSMV